jgi:uncharacterized protein
MRIPGGMMSILLLAWLVGSAWAESPRIAIVIDDLGFQPIRDRAILELDARLTAAIIPEAPLARRLARQAGREHRDVLVHLPLPGLHHDDCQPVLTCIGEDWEQEQVEKALLSALARVEGAIGLNNHQGSRFTGDPEAVARLVAGIGRISQQRGQPLLVLDSRTVPGSLLERKARQAGLPAGRRHIFLDHSDAPEDIERAWQDLVELARRRGSAVAIAHPRPNTIAFLSEALLQLEDQGIELVPISALTLQAEPAGRGWVDAAAVSAP